MADYISKKNCEQKILNAIADCVDTVYATREAKTALQCAIAVEKLSNAYINLKDIKEDKK